MQPSRLPFLRTLRPLALAASLPAALAACEAVGLAENPIDHGAVRQPAAREEPPVVEVQHVLISFAGAGLPNVTRTKDEAKALAERVYDLARGGRDFGDLVRLYSDDRHGDGFFRIANFGMPLAADTTERARLVRGFTRAAFSLEPGQTALVANEPAESPFGWHVIRRLR